MRKSGLAASLFLALAFSGGARAQVTTLTFDELTTRPVDGLQFAGVAFNFTVGGLASPDARYNAVGPGNLTYVQGAVLEGTALGTLTLGFAQPTPLLGFGVALTSMQSLTPGFTVELFDPASQSLGVTSVNTDPLISFSEGQFNYAGAPISQAVINFNAAALPPGARRFAFDNLVFQTGQAIPEPGMMIPFGTGLAAVAAAGSHRRRKVRQKG